jgi:hypothetical protein
MWSTPSKPNYIISLGLLLQQLLLCEIKLTSQGVCHREQANTPGHGWIFPSTNIVGQSVEYVQSCTTLGEDSQSNDADEEEYDMAKGGRYLNRIE